MNVHARTIFIVNLSFISSERIMEDELPVKLIELSDFLRSPSILSSRLQFKSSKSNNQLIKTEQGSNRLQFKQTTLPGIVLLKQKLIASDDYPNAQEDERKVKELIVPKDVIIFADEIYRKKLALIHKSNRLFSRLVQQQIFLR